MKILSDRNLILQDEKNKGKKGVALPTQLKIIHENNNLTQTTKIMNEQLKTGGLVIERLALNFQTFTEHLIEVKIKLHYNKKYFHDTKNH